MLVVSNAFRSLAGFLPRGLRAEIENDLPSLSIAAGRLAMEILDAETNGLKYIDAIELPSYPLMARVHYGVLDTLQWRMPPQILGPLRTVCQSAARGDFDPFRKLIFDVATRRNDPEAALARFLLFQGIRLNLYIWTWEQPEFEAWGCLRQVEDEAQETLETWLMAPEIQDTEVRPLHILVADAVLQLGRRASRMTSLLRAHIRDVVDEMTLMTDATRLVRALDAADAAVFRPGHAKEKAGSQRIADRFPWHFPSANAVEQRRSRFRKKLKVDEPPTPSGDRLIDVILGEMKNNGDR